MNIDGKEYDPEKLTDEQKVLLNFLIENKEDVERCKKKVRRYQKYIMLCEKLGREKFAELKALLDDGKKD